MRRFLPLGGDLESFMTSSSRGLVGVIPTLVRSFDVGRMAIDQTQGGVRLELDSKVVKRSGRFGDRSDGNRGGVQRPAQMVKGEVNHMTKSRVFRLTMLIGGIGAAVASLAAPLKW
jgi:hypothetical protein